MPWCPNCKNEYKDGITVCSDCGAALIQSLEELNEQEIVKYTFGTKNEMEQLYEFMKFGGLSYVELKCEENAEEAENYFIEIEKKEEKEAERLSSIYYKELNKKEPSDGKTEIEEQNDRTSLPEDTAPVPFVKASERAENYRSSAYALLLIGILGIIALLLIAAGIISISIADNIKVISFITMLLLFLVFTFMGIKALKDAKKFAADSEKEDQLSADIRSWFLEQYTKEVLDEAADVCYTPDIPEEMKYFKRINYMKAAVIKQFGDLDASFLDKNTEDLYTEIYEH